MSTPATKRSRKGESAKAKTPASATQGSESDSESSSSSDSDTSDDGQHQEKILKSLAFPEIESGSFSSDMCPKVNKCINKRLQKLEAHYNGFAEDSQLTDIQKQWGSRKTCYRH